MPDFVFTPSMFFKYAKCLDCSETPKDVKLCPIDDCPLWVWRFGKRPATVRKSRPWALSPQHVQLAGFVDAVLADHPKHDPWADSDVLAAIERIFGDEQPNREWIGNLLNRSIEESEAEETDEADDDDPQYPRRPR